MTDEEYRAYLASQARRPSPWGSSSGERIRYTRGGVEIPIPRITTVPLGKVEKFTLGEELVRRIELGEDPEKVFRLLLHRGTRQVGASKERVARYLKNALEEAVEEGRI